MQRLWAWLTDSNNQKTLGFLAGGLAVAIGAVWTVYLEFFQRQSPSPLRTVENACGVAAGGGNVTISGVTCTFGISIKEYEAALKRHEEKLQAKLKAVEADAKLELSLAQDLQITQKRLLDVEAAYKQRNESIEELARTLENGAENSPINQAFEKAVETGDTTELEDNLRNELRSDTQRAADRAHQLAILLRQQGQFTEAYDVLKTAIVLSPKNTDIRADLNRLASQLDVLLGEGRLRMSAVLAEDGDPVKAVHYVYEPEADVDGNRKRISYREGTANWFTLPAGRYFVNSITDYASHSQFIEVAAGKDTNTVLVLDAGRLRMSAVLAEDGDPVKAVHYVYEPEADLDGNRKRISYREGTANWFTLPAGRYFVNSITDYASHSQFIEVAAGKDTNTVLVLDAGRLRMSAVLAEDGDPVKAVHYVYEPEADLDGNRKRISYREGTANWFTLPAGRYFVNSITDYASHSQFIEVAAGKDTNTVLVLDAGRLRMSAVLAEDGDPVKAVHYVYEPEADLDGNRKRISYREGTANWFTLPAGRYYLESQAGDKRASAETQIVANKDNNVVMQLKPSQ